MSIPSNYKPPRIPSEYSFFFFSFTGFLSPTRNVSYHTIPPPAQPCTSALSIYLMDFALALILYLAFFLPFFLFLLSSNLQLGPTDPPLFGSSL